MKTRLTPPFFHTPSLSSTTFPSLPPSSFPWLSPSPLLSLSFLPSPPPYLYIIHPLSLLLAFHLLSFYLSTPPTTNFSFHPPLTIHFSAAPSPFFMLRSIPLSLEESKLNPIRCNNLITFSKQVDQRGSSVSVCMYLCCLLRWAYQFEVQCPLSFPYLLCMLLLCTSWYHKNLPDSVIYLVKGQDTAQKSRGGGWRVIGCIKHRPLTAETRGLCSAG